MSNPYRYAVVTASDGERSLVVHAVTQSEWDELVAEVDRLARWKEEALHVLGQWDLVGLALGSPGALGESRAEAALAAVTELAAERDRLRDAIHAHRDAVKCCDECASAQAEDRSTVDGILWAEVDR
jgi:hypothetical protein